MWPPKAATAIFGHKRTFLKPDRHRVENDLGAGNRFDGRGFFRRSFDNHDGESNSLFMCRQNQLGLTGHGSLGR